MIRNVVWLVSSAAILLLVFFGYSRIVSDPRRDETDVPTDDVALPEAQDPNKGAPLTIGTMTLPPGGQFNVTRYDPQTGQPRERIRGDEWKPVPGARDEIFVTKPELTILLPSGMIATISGDEAQLRVDRVSNKRAAPKLGWLDKNVRIEIDRETASERRPLDERPEDRITIRMDRMEFDLELGKLATEGPVHLENVDFEVRGTGLALEWNQAANRVESLLLKRGEELVFYGGNGLFGGPMGGGAPNTSPASAPTASADAGEQTAAPSTSAPSGAEPRHKQRTPVAYEFSLGQGVEVTQFAGDQPAGGLKAEKLKITFDVGGRAAASLLSRNTQSRRTAARSGEGRLAVKWTGPLRMMPVDIPPNTKKPRRHIEATGPDVRLQRGETEIRCSKLEYYDETEQVWLTAPQDGRIEFDLGPKLTAGADSVYVDRAANLVKLIGDVTLDSREAPPVAGAPVRSASGTAKRATSIHAAHWAELYLVPSTRTAASQPANAPSSAPDETVAVLPTTADAVPAPATVADAGRARRGGAGRPQDPLLDSGGLRRAVFMGDVRVTLADQTLRAQRLETQFRPKTGEEAFEELLTEAIASGGARMESRGDTLAGQEVRVGFANGATGEVYANKLDAIGGVEIRQQAARPAGPWDWAIEVCDSPTRALTQLLAARAAPAVEALIDGERVIASLLPPPADSEVAFVLERIEISGRARLQAPREQVSARGEQIAASFVGENELRQATVRGDGARTGRVRAGAYAVHGQDIVLSQFDEALHVNGPSRMVLQSERGLQGGGRGRRAPLTIRASRALHIDGKANLATFEGEVSARSGDEYMLADAMTLTLEDAKDGAAKAAPQQQPLVALLKNLLAAAHGGRAAASDRKPLVSGGAGQAKRKEPLRLDATNANIVSETPDPAGGLPLVHSSIVAPKLDVDIPNRVIHSVGRTALLLTNRRLGDDVAGERDALGVPSALITKGPSQTAMQSDGGMTYAIGREDPAGRRDSVLFEGGVVFVHRAGSEMVNIAQMLPQIAGDKEALAKLKSRATYLECQRLECTFIGAPSADAGGLTGGGLGGMGAGQSGGAALRLAWLMARENVYLRDRQGTGIREVRATRMEFDRGRSVVGVFGTPAVPARIEFMDMAANRYDQPATGTEFEIDLNTGLPRAKETKGQFSRP